MGLDAETQEPLEYEEPTVLIFPFILNKVPPIKFLWSQENVLFIMTSSLV
jgi:hypothetical protein